MCLCIGILIKLTCNWCEMWNIKIGGLNKRAVQANV